VPRGLGAWLLGPIWQPAYPLVLPSMLVAIGQAVSFGAGTGLHALGAARRSLRVMIFGSILFVVCALVGAVTGGVVGTVRGTAISVWVGALVIWWQLRVAMRESGTVPASAGFLSGRPAGRHRPAPVRAVTPWPDIALDAPVPIPAVPKAAAFAPAAATSSPPSTEAGQAAPRGPVKPAPRPKMPAAARAVLATGVMTALAGVAVAGWMLVHQSAGF